MSLLTQAHLLDKFGPRLDVEQLGQVLALSPKTILNQISARSFSVPTYVDGGKRWADVRDVAERFDALRDKAA